MRLMAQLVALSPLGLLLSLGLGCDKKEDVPKLEPTMDGRNFVHYKVDGRTIIVSGEPTLFSPAGVSISRMKHPNEPIVVQLAAWGEDDDDMLIEVPTEYPALATRYPAINRGPFIQSWYYKGNGNHKCYFDSATSFVTFTRFDSSVAAGTFEAHGTTDTGGSFHLTEGWFDIAR